MTTLAVDTAVVEVKGELDSIPIIASDTVFEGAMVGENSSGYGRPLVAGDKFKGHAIYQVANETGSAGDKEITVRRGRYRLDVALVALITDLDVPVFASDDATLTLDASGNSFVGVITRYVSATRMEVEFRPGEDDEFGPDQNRDTKTDDYTTDAEDNGKIIYLSTDTKTVTLIATVAGYRVRIVNNAGDGTAEIHVDPNASDNFLGGPDQAAGGDGKKLSNTKATQKRGDYLDLLGDGTAGWNIVGMRGTWAMES